MTSREATAPAARISTPGRSTSVPTDAERSTASRATGAVLAVVVGVSFVVRAVAGIARPGPWILPDELLYTDLARSIASGDLPAVRGVTSIGWGVVYPLVVAPAWLVFDDGVLAFHAATVINAFVMSLAAIPGYLFTRLFASRRAALLVAAGTVLVPSMALTSSVMTENAAYPLLLTALWLVARAVRRPDATSQLAALTAIAALTLTRTQGAALLLVLVAAACLYAAASEVDARRPYLSRFRPTALVLGALAALAVAAGAAGLGNPLGRRSTAVDVLAADGLPRLLALQTADLLLLVAVAPVLATVSAIAAGVARGAPEPQRLFAAVALPALVIVMLSVSLVTSSVDTEGAQGINERYVFSLVPLLLAGLAVWAESGARPTRVGLGALALAVILVGLLPFDELKADATFYAPALVPWVALPDGYATTAAAVVFTAGLGLVVLGRGARRTRLSAIATTSWLAVVSLIAAVGFQHHATTAAEASSLDEPTWIDDAVPHGEEVLALWDERTAARGAPDADYYPLMVAATLNRSVTRTLRLGRSTYYDNVIPTVPVTAGAEGVLFDAVGAPIRARFVLVPCPIAIEGRPVARSDDRRLAVYALARSRIRIADPRPCPTG